jgi:hypothetical protein
MLAYFVRCGALVLATCGAIAAMSSVARADLVLMDANGTQVSNPAASVVDLGANGFATAPRMLTLETDTVETGSVTPVGVVHGDAVPGINKSDTPTLAELGWVGVNGASHVGIGLSTDQTSQTGLTLQSLTLTIYNGTAPVAGGSFSLTQSLLPLTFSGVDLALIIGSPNSVFHFGLTAAEQADFNAVLAMPGSSGFLPGFRHRLAAR